MPESTATKTPKQPLKNFTRKLAIILIVTGVIGLIASLAITIEKFTLLQHPGSQFACDLNPVISCGSVMESKQANAFGFMNTYIGLVGFPIVITSGVAMLAGAKFKRWYWLGMLGGLSLGILFAYWLLFESMYRIKALCPYCLSVDIALTTAFWYTWLYAFDQGLVKVRGRLATATGFMKRHHLDILLLWFVAVIVLILQHFWYYYGDFLK